MPLCPHCGDEQEIDLHEVWDDREFMVWTCCEQSEEDVRWELANDREETEASITSKLARRTFTAIFLLASLAALEVVGMRLENL